MMRQHRRMLTAALVALVGLALGMTACGGGGEESQTGGGTTGGGGEMKTLRMGIEPWIGYGPWWVADAKGFDKKNGVDIKITNFTTDADINSAFAAGRIDAENLATHTGLRFLGSGIDLKFVLFEDVSRTADAILAGPEIQSVNDLAGKKVAFEEGTTSDILLRYALAQNGMTLDDVDVVPIPASDAGSAVIAGRVEAAVTYEPYLTAALKQGKGFHLVYSAGEQPGLISDLLAVNPDYASENGDAVVAALKAWGEAMDFYNSNPDEAQAIIAEKVGAKPEELKESFAGVDLYDLEKSQNFISSEWLPLAAQVIDVLKSQKDGLESVPDAKAATDDSFLKKALGQ
jgi:NitT/TauT family transport system substrate-binding protein